MARTQRKQAFEFAKRSRGTRKRAALAMARAGANPKVPSRDYESWDVASTDFHSLSHELNLSNGLSHLREEDVLGWNRD